LLRLKAAMCIVCVCQCDTDDGISSDSESPTSVHSLIRQMQEKERHILHLETEVARVSHCCQSQSIRVSCTRK